MSRYVCIHGHFYQPPRENPWLEDVELQDSALPYHDWNERVTAECYGPNATSRIVDPEGRIVNIINNYARMSFNFGPTLLSWMERHAPRVLEAIQEADRLSRRRFGGHGSAMAQVYNHMIMPLAGDDRKRTQVHWGMEDFRRRFGRDPEGMWLPECAVDTPSLEVLAEFGIAFVVLAPSQARRTRRLLRTPGRTSGRTPKAEVQGEAQDSGPPWSDHAGDVDPTAAYRLALPSGRSIAAFFYDAPISGDVAFGELTRNGEALHHRLLAAFADAGRDWPQLVHIATDGETYGHHHPLGDMALAWCLTLLEQDPTVLLTNYGQYLKKHPPVVEAEIHENSSWSCPHGVERWRADCGCSGGGHPRWNQAWRAPLRQATDWLAGEAEAQLAAAGAALFKDPKAARDDSIRIILDRSSAAVSGFLADHAANPLTSQTSVAMLKLLEMARMAELIHTSCAWFFDEVTGIETVQILQYAARLSQLLGEVLGRSPEPRLLALLAKAPSNLLKNGAQAYELYAKPAKAGLLHAAAHAAMASLFEERPPEPGQGPIPGPGLGMWEVTRDAQEALRSGYWTLVTGLGHIASPITWESMDFMYAAAWFGGHHVLCGVQPAGGPQDLAHVRRTLTKDFERGDQGAVLGRISTRFGEHTYSLARLFRDKQRDILALMLAPARQAALEAYRRIFDSSLDMLRYLQWLRAPLPEELVDAGRHVAQHDLERLFTGQAVDWEQARALADGVARWGLRLEKERPGMLATAWIGALVEAVEARPAGLASMETAVEALELAHSLALPLRLWKAQNACFRLAGKPLARMAAKAAAGDATAGKWVEAFLRLAKLLGVKAAH